VSYRADKKSAPFGINEEALFAYSVGHHKAKRLLSADRTPHTRYTKRVIAEYKKNTEKLVSL